MNQTSDFFHFSFNLWLIAGKIYAILNTVGSKSCFVRFIHEIKGVDLGLFAKIKYKSGRALQRWSEFSRDEKIITVCVIALFLPYYLVAVPGIFAVLRALLLPSVRRSMTSVSSSGYIYASLPIFVFPALAFRNWFGLFGGIVLWLMLVFMLYLFSVVRRRFYNNIIDLMLILSTTSMLTALASKFIYNYFGVSLYHFVFGAHGGLLPSTHKGSSAIFGFLFDSCRTASVFWNPNYYGYMLEIFVILALYRFEKRHSPWYLIILFANLGSILLCDCRTAWVAHGAALLDRSLAELAPLCGDDDGGLFALRLERIDFFCRRQQFAEAAKYINALLPRANLKGIRVPDGLTPHPADTLFDALKDLGVYNKRP